MIWEILKVVLILNVISTTSHVALATFILGDVWAFHLESEVPVAFKSTFGIHRRNVVLRQTSDEILFVKGFVKL